LAPCLLCSVVGGGRVRGDLGAGQQRGRLQLRGQGLLNPPADHRLTTLVAQADADRPHITRLQPLIHRFARCKNLSSFGPGSPFEQLVEMEAVNLALGTEFVGGATFLHHTEEVAAVPYRFYKEFPGQVLDAQGQVQPDHFRMYVREITDAYEYDNDWAPVWELFVSQGLVRQQNLAGANIFAMDIKPAHACFLSTLQAQPYYCAIKNIKERG
ncbi:MAG: AAC(3) family N-acetyltransferase, partial [Burkholderiaceae bacterium]|nr:AAC(3) family N-acetyltransferase [Burkholderiaceae bacterium]